MGTPKQITVRNPSPELARRLQELAAARGESLNSTILHVLAVALGVDERRARLRRYATWSNADRAEFEASLRQQRVIDEDLWR